MVYSAAKKRRKKETMANCQKKTPQHSETEKGEPRYYDEPQ